MKGPAAEEYKCHLESLGDHVVGIKQNFGTSLNIF